MLIFCEDYNRMYEYEDRGFHFINHEEIAKLYVDKKSLTKKRRVVAEMKDGTLHTLRTFSTDEEALKSMKIIAYKLNIGEQV